MTKVVEIRNQEQYHQGLRYLKRFFPYNIHAISCYTGSAFRNTYRMLCYDINNQLLDNDIDLKGITRYLVFSEDNKIEGVAVTCYIPEFAQYLEYEKYIIIIADTYNAFQLLIQEHKNKRIEVITFRRAEKRYISKNNSIREIHFWNNYILKGKSCDINIEKPHEEDFNTDNMKGLKYIKMYWEFEKMGIKKYHIFVLKSKNNKPIAFCALIPYFDNISEIKLFYNDEIELYNSNILIDFLKTSIFAVLGKGGKGVFRVKNIDLVLQRLFFTNHIMCISREQHFHLNMF